MKPFGTIAVALLIVIVLIAGILSLNAAFPTPGERAARDARAQAWANQADERAELFSLFAASLAAVTVLTAAGIGAALVRLALVRSETLHAHRDTALYPAVRVAGQWLTVNEQGAQTFAALPARPTAAVTRALLETPRATGMVAAPQVIDASATEVMPYAPQFDLITSPHFLFAGQTGRGKTTAMWQVATALARTYDVRWMICEPGGANWKELATATDIAGIAGIVANAHAEMLRRLELLRASTANHVANLPEPPPYLGFVVEEAESVYSDLSIANRDQARLMAVQLRQLAAMGRKAGIAMFFGTQTALRVVFDGSVLENIGNVYLFGGAQHLAERFRVSRDIRLPDLAPGQAYCPRQGGIIQFARVQRPTDLRLALPAPGDTRSDTQTVTEAVITPVTPPNGHSGGVITPGVTPMPAEPGAPTDAQRQAVIDAYRRSGSLRATQRALFPGQVEGGHWFYWIRSIIQDAHR